MWDYFVESIVWTFCEPIFIVDSAGASPTFQFQSFERGSRDAARIFEFALGCNAKRHRSLRSFSFPPLKLEEKHRLLFLSRATNAGINAHAHLQGLGAPPSNRPNLPQVPAIETHVWLRDWANSLRPRTDGLLQSDAHFRVRTLPRPLTTFADDRRWQAILAAHREPLEALVDQYDLWDSHAAASRAEQWVKHALDRLTPTTACDDHLRFLAFQQALPSNPNNRCRNAVPLSVADNMRPLERRLAEVFNWSGLYQFKQSGLALWLLIASFFGRANVQTLAQIVEQPTIQVADQLVRMWRKVFEII